MIAVAQYGSGNVQAIVNVYARLDIEVCVASTPSQLRAADRIVLPGVGSFDWSMQRLNSSGLRDALEEAVLGRAKPVLGICVGMQMLADRSDEGVLPGLGWIHGEVRPFDVSSSPRRAQLPHMGWNDVRSRDGVRLFLNLDTQAQFYFLHSYVFVPDDDKHTLAEADYYGPFAASVGVSSVYGVQFHPEKSHQWGARLLKNFAEL